MNHIENGFRTAGGQQNVNEPRRLGAGVGVVQRRPSELVTQVVHRLVVRFQVGHHHRHYLFRPAQHRHMQ